MKKYVFIALFFTAFMFPFFGSINNADALGNYGCGNPDKRTHVHCLRGLLASTPYGLSVKQSNPSSDGLGNYGCGNPDKRTHVNCLRGLLDQHGAHLQVGNPAGGAPGMHPPMGEDCAAMPTPTEVASCWDRQNHAPGPGMASGTHTPVDISHCASLEPTAARPACEAAAHGGPPPGDHPDCPAGTNCGGPNDHHGGPGNHPPSGPNDHHGGPGNHPPTGP